MGRVGWRETLVRPGMVMQVMVRDSKESGLDRVLARLCMIGFGMVDRGREWQGRVSYGCHRGLHVIV